MTAAVGGGDGAVVEPAPWLITRTASAGAAQPTSVIEPPSTVPFVGARHGLSVSRAILIAQGRRMPSRP